MNTEMNREEKIELKQIRETQLKDALKMSDLLNHYKDLKIEFSQYRSESLLMKEDISKILGLLSDDPNLGVVGISRQVKLNTTFREEFKTKVATIGFVGGGMAGLIAYGLKLIFKL
jgi:hypothetical protein